MFILLLILFLIIIGTVYIHLKIDKKKSESYIDFGNRKCSGIKMYDRYGLFGKEKLIKVNKEKRINRGNKIKSLNIPENCVAELTYDNDDKKILCSGEYDLNKNYGNVKKIEAKNSLKYAKKCNPDFNIAEEENMNKIFSQYSITSNNKSCEDSGYFPVMDEADCMGAIKHFNKVLGDKGGQYSKLGDIIPAGSENNTANPNTGKNMEGIPEFTKDDKPYCSIMNLNNQSGKQRFYTMNVESRYHNTIKKDDKYQMICRTEPKPYLDNNKISPTTKGCPNCPYGCDSDDPTKCYNYPYGDILDEEETMNYQMTKKWDPKCGVNYKPEGADELGGSAYEKDGEFNGLRYVGEQDVDWANKPTAEQCIELCKEDVNCLGFNYNPSFPRTEDECKDTKGNWDSKNKACKGENGDKAGCYFISMDQSDCDKVDPTFNNMGDLVYGYQVR